jgi:preprotein translocase subunit Sec61beta
MTVQVNVQRRAFHRVRFPSAEQPRWLVGDSSFAVIDLSETGCRLAIAGHGAIGLAQTWAGYLRFMDGEEVWVEGTPIRLDPDSIVVQLAKGIGFKKIISLQRELLRKYPALRDLTSRSE